MTGSDLARWRKKLKLSRDELARQLKVSSSTVWRWEKGERPLPPYLELALETLERRIKEQG